MPQYTLSLSLPPLFSEDNFFVSPCNHDAWQWIKAWPNWNSHALIVYGPEGCGKSHLGHIWAARANASKLEASAVEANPSSKQNWLIEDIERLADARKLLHFFNSCKEQGGQMLLTSSVAPKQLPFALPDLMSRLLALPAAHIDTPDDEVLASAMRKQFTDRQMMVDDEVITYILARVERSFTKIKELVEQLDALSLSEHKNISIALVRRLI